MGASVFQQYQKGNDLRGAFREAVDHARYEHGHAGYTDTLAEKNDVVLINEFSPMPLKAANAVAAMLINDDDERISSKWGPAGALPVGEDGVIEGWLFFGWASD